MDLATLRCQLHDVCADKRKHMCPATMHHETLTVSRPAARDGLQVAGL